LFYKITLYSPNNIIDSFKSNTIVTNFSTIFLQNVEIANSYWFISGPTTYIIFFYLPIPLTTSLIYNNNKKVCILNIFLLLKAIKKFIDLKSKIKCTNPKKKSVQQQKIPIAKLKKN